MTLTPRVKLIGTIVAIAVAVAIILSMPGCLSSLFSARTDARIKEGQGRAMTNAAGAAANTISNVIEHDARIDDAVKGGIDEIRSQPPGRSNDAAVRAACGMRSHYDSEQCARLRAADSARAAGARPVRSDP